MEHSTEHLEHFSNSQAEAEEKKESNVVLPRPLSHRIMAWLLIAAVLAAFCGMCYWIANFKLI